MTTLNEKDKKAAYLKVKKKKIKKKDPVGNPKNWSTPQTEKTLTPRMIDAQKLGQNRMTEKEYSDKWGNRGSSFDKKDGTPGDHVKTDKMNQSEFDAYKKAKKKKKKY
tara:strand:- start:40 stop:363 length:324 start_codon:yes stop_codon:yes gene_type:complete